MGKKPGRTEREHWAAAYGSDAEYLRWVSFQPSCVDSAFHQWQDGVGRTIACHVRRVNRGAGTGIKPPYSAVPMTQEQHLNEDRYPMEWRVGQAERHLREWVRSRSA